MLAELWGGGAQRPSQGRGRAVLSASQRRGYEERKFKSDNIQVMVLQDSNCGIVVGTETLLQEDNNVIAWTGNGIFRHRSSVSRQGNERKKYDKVKMGVRWEWMETGRGV